MTNNLQVPSEILDKARKELIEIYKEHPKFNENPEAKAEETLQKALAGWPRAPKSFQERINRLAGLQANPRAAKDNAAKAAKDKLLDENKKLMETRGYRGKLTNSIFNQLNDEEKNLWLERERYYFNEFEFNTSSDYATLLMLLFDEILMQRMAADKLANPALQMDRGLTDCHKRILDSHKALGIQKTQRDSVEGDDEGSLAAIAASLDKKKVLRAKRKEAERKEEEEFLELRKDRDNKYRDIKTGNIIRDGDVQKLIEGLDYDE